MQDKSKIHEPLDYSKLNALYDTFVPQKELSREQLFWSEAMQNVEPPTTPISVVERTKPA